MSNIFKVALLLIVIGLFLIGLFSIKSAIQIYLGTNESAVITNKEAQGSVGKLGGGDYEYRFNLLSGRYEGKSYNSRTHKNYEIGSIVEVKVAKDGSVAGISIWNFNLTSGLLFIFMAGTITLVAIRHYAKSISAGLRKRLIPRSQQAGASANIQPDSDKAAKTITSSQEDTLENLRKKSRSRAINLPGVIICVLGAVMFVTMPAALIGSRFEASNNQFGISETLWVTGLGLAFYAAGLKMMSLRRKIEKNDVSDRLDFTYFTSVFQDKKSIAIGEQSKVRISPKGILIQPNDQTSLSGYTIAWPDIQKTKWSTIHNHECYEIITLRNKTLFSAKPVSQARAGAAKYMATALASGPAGGAYATKIALDNAADVEVLTPLHMYARYYAPGATTKWGNYFETMLLSRLKQITMIIAILFWVGTVISGMGWNDHIIFKTLLGILFVCVVTVATYMAVKNIFKDFKLTKH